VWKDCSWQVDEGGVNPYPLSEGRRHDGKLGRVFSMADSQAMHMPRGSVGTFSDPDPFPRLGPTEQPESTQARINRALERFDGCAIVDDGQCYPVEGTVSPGEIRGALCNEFGHTDIVVTRCTYGNLVRLEIGGGADCYWETIPEAEGVHERLLAEPERKPSGGWQYQPISGYYELGTIRRGTARVRHHGSAGWQACAFRPGADEFAEADWVGQKGGLHSAQLAAEDALAELRKQPAKTCGTCNLCGVQGAERGICVRDQSNVSLEESCVRWRAR
jgi:hypothetical protein